MSTKFGGYANSDAHSTPIRSAIQQSAGLYFCKIVSMPYGKETSKQGGGGWHVDIELEGLPRSSVPVMVSNVETGLSYTDPSTIKADKHGNPMGGVFGVIANVKGSTQPICLGIISNADGGAMRPTVASGRGQAIESSVVDVRGATCIAYPIDTAYGNRGGTVISRMILRGREPDKASYEDGTIDFCVFAEGTDLFRTPRWSQEWWTKKRIILSDNIRQPKFSVNLYGDLTASRFGKSRFFKQGGGFSTNVPVNLVRTTLTGTGIDAATYYRASTFSSASAPTASAVSAWAYEQMGANSGGADDKNSYDYIDGRMTPANERLLLGNAFIKNYMMNSLMPWLNMLNQRVMNFEQGLTFANSIDYVEQGLFPAQEGHAYKGVADLPSDLKPQYIKDESSINDAEGEDIPGYFRNSMYAHFTLISHQLHAILGSSQNSAVLNADTTFTAPELVVTGGGGGTVNVDTLSLADGNKLKAAVLSMYKMFTAAMLQMQGSMNAMAAQLNGSYRQYGPEHYDDLNRATDDITATGSFGELSDGVYGTISGVSNVGEHKFTDGKSTRVRDHRSLANYTNRLWWQWHQMVRHFGPSKYGDFIHQEGKASGTLKGLPTFNVLRHYMTDLDWALRDVGDNLSVDPATQGSEVKSLEAAHKMFFSGISNSTIARTVYTLQADLAKETNGQVSSVAKTPNTTNFGENERQLPMFCSDLYRAYWDLIKQQTPFYMSDSWQGNRMYVNPAYSATFERNDGFTTVKRPEASDLASYLTYWAHYAMGLPVNDPRVTNTTATATNFKSGKNVYDLWSEHYTKATNYFTSNKVTEPRSFGSLTYNIYECPVPWMDKMRSSLFRISPLSMDPTYDGDVLTKWVTTQDFNLQTGVLEVKKDKIDADAVTTAPPIDYTPDSWTESEEYKAGSKTLTKEPKHFADIDKQRDRSKS